MKKDGTYRFCLQFKPMSEDDIRVGEFLERLGNKKSKLVICALRDFLEKNPESDSGIPKAPVEILSISRTEVEDMVRKIVAEKMGTSPTDDSVGKPVPDSRNVGNVIVEMLNDLELFQ